MGKKIIFSLGAAGTALALLPLFAAFEAHVINVTAKIENALEASTYSLDFGTVFPQEKFEKTFDISMSQSFRDAERFDDIEYVLRQKPKCQLNATGALVIPTLPQFGQSTESNGIFVCKDEVNYDLMPFLCPYLSKSEITPEPDVQGGENDMKAPGYVGPLASFHGPILLSPQPGGWDMQWTLTYQLLGRLAKSDNDFSDTWNIDFKVPCFGNHCAQDWADFVAANDGENNANPADYIQPIANEHLMFGCDIWVEVTELSVPPTRLTVIKEVDNTNGGTAGAPDFTIHVSGTNVSDPDFPGAGAPGTTVDLDPGPYSVTEDPVVGYTSNLSDPDCSGVIAVGETKVCTITNTADPANLILNKIVTKDDGGTADASEWTLYADGPGANDFSGPGPSVSDDVPAGTYDLSESAGPAGYAASSWVCVGGSQNGSQITLGIGESATCTITNDDIAPTITLIKEVSGGQATENQFVLRIEGNAVAHNTPIPVPAGVAQTISEDAFAGYSVTSVSGTGCPATLPNDVTLALDEDITCTITNTADAPTTGTLIVKKIIINDDGGTITNEEDFSFQVNGGSATAFEADGQNNLTVSAGQYDITEPAVAGYTTTYDNCTDVDVAAGETETCTITNNDEPILACDAELDLMLVLDRSGSISSSELQTLKTAAHAFVDTLNPATAGAHVGQSSFSTASTLDLHLTDDEAASHLAINALTTGGSTDLEAGITTAINELDNLHIHERAAVPDAIVVISDGEPNIPDDTQGPIDAAAAADAARAAGIEVFVVGVGVSSSTETFLKTDIADDAAHYFSAADFEDLEAALQALVACDKVLKTYTYSGVTTANDGTSGNPIAFEYDSDVFPWTVAGDINNSTTTPSDAEYAAIATDDSSRWTTADPGGSDFAGTRYRFTLTEAIADIDDIKILWKGNPEATANMTLWLHEAHTSDVGAANWDAQGAAVNIPAGSDRYIVRHLTSGFATYVDPVTGMFEVFVSMDNDNEDMRVDYIQLLVTSTP